MIGFLNIRQHLLVGLNGVLYNIQQVSPVLINIRLCFLGAFISFSRIFSAILDDAVHLLHGTGCLLQGSTLPMSTLGKIFVP